MREFRYDHTARCFDEDLEKDLVAHEAEKTAKREAATEPNALRRMAEEKSPLDEVRDLIDSSRHKAAEDEIREHGVRKKLAAIRDGERASIDTFITQAKNG